MKKILVPTDFSPQAENALRVAAQFAKMHNYEIHLLHIVELPPNQVDPILTYSKVPEAIFFMKLAHKHFETLLNKNYLNGIQVYEHVEFDAVFRGVNNLCEKQNIDLIVMGSQGASGFTEMFIGSNTEKVVRTSTVPVLVIKKEHTDFKIDNFVFASDFNEENKIPFKKAIDFIKLLNSKTHLLMVNTPNRFITTLEAEDKIHKFVKDVSLSNYSFHLFNDETVEQGIMNFSKSINANLIGMSTHGRQGISHFFNGSISEDLVNHLKTPIITFKI